MLLKNEPNARLHAGADSCINVPMREVLVRNAHRRLKLDRANRAALVRAIGVLDAHREKFLGGCPDGELSIVFMGDRALAKLHDDFLDDPATTDVITFEGAPEFGVAGEVCVSVDTAMNYAKAHGGAFAEELMLYVVHGWLHLAGYDDLQPAKKRKMRAAEKRAMTLLRKHNALPKFSLKAAPAKKNKRAAGKMKLGVFDSGIGGEALAEALRKTFPKAEIIVVNDRANVPYGSKPPRTVLRLTDAAIQPLRARGCDVIILACNTATALAIDALRAKYPAQKFIGIEPMVKTAAALTRSKTIAVCATAATLASARYKRLVREHGAALRVIEPDCGEWASLIENNRMNRSHIQKTIDDVCEQGADVIVLGCTHYHWIKELVTDLAAGRAQVIEPSEAIGRRVKTLLGER